MPSFLGHRWDQFAVDGVDGQDSSKIEIKWGQSAFPSLEVVYDATQIRVSCPKSEEINVFEYINVALRASDIPAIAKRGSGVHILLRARTPHTLGAWAELNNFVDMKLRAYAEDNGYMFKASVKNDAPEPAHWDIAPVDIVDERYDQMRKKIAVALTLGVDPDF